MKKTLLPLILIIVVLALIIAFAQKPKNITEIDDTDAEYVVDDADLLDASLVAEIAPSQLSDEERDGLLMMREEEKLARDVYLALYDIWGQKIFYNIAQSEQTHTDAVKTLLDRYQMEDPVVSDEIGVFTDSRFSELFVALTQDGSESLVAALRVGATIEDLDIRDINDLLEDTNNTDIEIVYENLIRGSKNHMRAFVGQLERQGEGYEAQYISAEELAEVLGK